MFKLVWSEIKDLCVSKKLNLQFLENNSTYRLWVTDGQVLFNCELDRFPTDTTDLLDFETNFKDGCNKKLTDIDEQGRQVTRVATGQSGSVYIAHPVEFKTATFNSLYEKTHSNTDRAISTIKFYDVDNIEVTDSAYESTIVKTVVTFKPGYDYELISGSIHQKATPSSDLRIWVIGGILELGGAYVREFAGGLNMSYFDSGESPQTDGRSSKYMKKDIPGVPYAANQMQIIVRHEAGVQHYIMSVFEYYRA